MTILEALFTRLGSVSGVTSLLKTSGGDLRIYPKQIPQNSPLPAVSYEVISIPRTSAFGQDLSNVAARFQYNAYDTSYTTVVQVTNQLRLALQRYRTTSGITIEDIFVVNEFDMPFEPETKLFHRVIEFSVNYLE